MPGHAVPWTPPEDERIPTTNPRREQENAMSADTPRRSRLTTEGMGRAPNRAMLRAVGFLDDDFSKPMVGVASLFSDITPCNAHLDRLARKAVEGVRAAGGVGQIFGAPTASDGMYPANTMSSGIEAMGVSLPYDASHPAVSAAKERETFLAGGALVRLIERGVKPRDLITRRSLENAYTAVLALGGSTNAVLHLLAIAREAELDWTLADFDRLGDRVPDLADLKPSGKYVMNDLHKVGGTPAVFRA